MRKIINRDILANYWRPLVMYGLLFGFLGGLLFWRLANLLPGYSANELHTYQAGASLRQIIENPVNLPAKLWARGVTELHMPHALLFMRLGSILLGCLTLLVFYGLLRHWHGNRTAFFGTLLFGTSSWFLHAARSGTPDVWLLLFFILVACGVWLRETGNRLALLLCLSFSALLLYVPGMIWLIALGAMWQWQALDRVFKKRLWVVSLGGLIVTVAIMPLAWSLYHHPTLTKQFLGLPASGWPQPLHVLHQLAAVPVCIFVHGQANPEMWLGNLPLLGVFSSVMLLIGVYVYRQHIDLQRSRLLVVVFLGGALLIGLGGSVTLTLLLPFLYLLVAAGIHYMLMEWFRVFPRNPIAQNIGLAVLGIAVVFSCTFDLRRYFIAWPHTAATRQVFVIQEPRASDTIKR